jgi:hypothetical protein
MAQIVSIVPTLMWLQHSFGHSLLGNDDTLTNIPMEKTIEFSPNRDLQQQSATLNTFATGSFTDMEAGFGNDGEKEGSSTLGRSTGRI